MFNPFNALNPATTRLRTVRQGLALLFAVPLMVALLLLGGSAFADTYTIDAYNVDNSRGKDIYINENGTPTHTYFTGVILITLTDTNTGQTWNRDTLCVDLFVDIYMNQTYWTTVLSPAAVPGRNLPRVAWLVNNASSRRKIRIMSPSCRHRIG